MEITSGIPKPKDSGVTGEQSTGGEYIPRDQPDEVKFPPPSNYAQALNSLGNENSTRLGGKMGATLVPLLVQNLENEKERLSQKVDSLTSEKESLTKELHNLDIRNSVLSQKLVSQRKSSAMAQCALFTSPLLIGITISNIPNELIYAKSLILIISVAIGIYGLAQNFTGAGK
ncbi:hypothetical protein [Phytopseudomonas daroniae]|uniref:hypothetical protein n=1 Tax=Phytopseudomonas daroniae TaxID=2487519 RepID=UPI001038382A|nr:hypothetical protein [Pseudomonas daroniae]